MKSRVQRRHTPNRVIKRSTYRQFWNHLALDFENRCAYSMQHTYRAGGEQCMEIDHFNPKRKNDYIQDYENLFLSTRHCNGAKRNRWPTNDERRKGIRFLNCCEEMDFGVHIFEDPDTHELVGVTPQGKYHVRSCDLNAPHLVEERAERANLKSILEERAVFLKRGWELPGELQALKQVLATMIPSIPHLEGQALANHRARRAALAALNG